MQSVSTKQNWPFYSYNCICNCKIL